MTSVSARQTFAQDRRESTWNDFRTLMSVPDPNTTVGPPSDRIKVLELLSRLFAPLGRLDERKALNFAVDLEGHHPAANDRGRDPDVARGPVRQPDVDALKVGLEGAAAHAGRL